MSAVEPLPCHLCGNRMQGDGRIWTHTDDPDEGCFLAMVSLEDDDDIWRWNNVREPARTPSEEDVERVARENIPDEAIYEAMDAMQNAVIQDDEGEFPRLFDLLGFSGENKAVMITYGLASAAIYAAAPIVIRAAINALEGGER